MEFPNRLRKESHGPSTQYAFLMTSSRARKVVQEMLLLQLLPLDAWDLALCSLYTYPSALQALPLLLFTVVSTALSSESLG